MCGINGIIFKKSEVDFTKIINMNNMLQHRGPDSKGSMSYKNLLLGHTRLSILDTSTKGNQPMSNEGAAIVGIVIIPIIGVIAFVLFIVWAIFYEMKRSKKMKEEGKEDEMTSKQLFTILLVMFALMALPKTIATILSFFD